MNAKERKALIDTLRHRFERNMQRHLGMAWAAVEARLAANQAALDALQAMEKTGGEPDVIGQEGQGKSAAFVFCDCSAESPAGRRSLCFDAEALDARKENKPAGSALGMAAGMGVALLT